MVAIYIAGNSIVHRTPLLIKIVVLSILVVGGYVYQNIYYMGAGVVLCVLLFLLAHVSLAYLWRSIYMMRIILLFVAVYYIIFITWSEAFVYTLRIIIAVGFANLLALTTPLHTMLNKETWFSRFLEFLHVPVKKIRLMIYIVLRTIPLLTVELYEIQIALTLRGQRSIGRSKDRVKREGIIDRTRNSIRMIFPLLLRSVLQTDQFVEALKLRGEL